MDERHNEMMCTSS